MNKILVLFAVSLFALLYSCGDNAQRNQSSDARLYLNVQDAHDGSSISGAKATLGTSKGTTDSKGLVKFKLKAGTNVLFVEKENYASIRKIIGGNDVASNGASIIDDIYENLQLYPTTAGLKGVLYYNDPKGNLVPMPDVEIRVDIPYSNLATISYPCGKTDSKGEYVCENLPAVGTSYYVYALGGTQANGTTYAVADITPEGVSLSSGIVSNSPRKNYSTALSAFVLVDKPADIEEANKGNPITLKFSEAVDVSQFKDSWITSNGQAISIKWKEGNTQLELTPQPNWVAGNITLTGIKSISGKTLSTTTIYITLLAKDITDEKVKGVTVIGVDGTAHGTPSVKDSILYSSTQAKITWNKLEGAEGYYVYVQLSDTSNYTYVAAGYDAKDTVKTVKINNSNPIGSKTVKIVVIAINSRGNSKFSDAVSVSAVDDGKAPTYASASTGPIFDPCGEWGGSYYNDATFGYDLGSCTPGYKQPGTKGSAWSGYCLSTVDANNIIKFCQEGGKEINADDELFSKAGAPTLAEILNDERAFDKDRVPGVKTPVLAYGNVFFNKPMDVSAQPTVKCELAGGDCSNKLSLETEWKGDQNLGLTLKTKAGNKISDASTGITFSITGLKSIEGIAFVANPSGATPENAVKIQFKPLPICASTPVYPCSGYCNIDNKEGKGKGDADNNINGDYINCKDIACHTWPNNAECKDYPELINWYCWTPAADEDSNWETICKEEVCGKNPYDSRCDVSSSSSEEEPSSSSDEDPSSSSSEEDP